MRKRRTRRRKKNSALHFRREDEDDIANGDELDNTFTGSGMRMPCLKRMWN